MPKSLREIRAGNREIRAGNREIQAGNREIRAGNREIWIFRNSSQSCTLQEWPVPQNEAAAPEPSCAAKPETQALVLATRIVPRPPKKQNQNGRPRSQHACYRCQAFRRALLPPRFRVSMKIQLYPPEIANLSLRIICHNTPEPSRLLGF